MWGALLILSTLALFTVPFLPAMAELVWPTDSQPLRVVQEYDRNIRHFAQGFRKYIDKNFSLLLNEPDREGTLGDGTRFRTAGPGGAVFANDPETIPYLIIAGMKLDLPDGHFFEAEVYSRNGINSGINNTFRALMAEEDITLGEHNSVMRWVHAGRQLSMGKGCALFGRASADGGIMLADDCVFERMSAPIIEFGPYQKQEVDIALAEGVRTPLESLPDVREHYGRRWLVDGDIDFPAQHYFDGDMVAGNAMKIGAYSHIKGSIKGNDDCHVGAHVCLEGSVVSAASLYLGPGCIVAGPVIAEEAISIAAGTVIGKPGHLTSVTAPRITIEPGAMVYGTVWAMEDGRVRVAGQSLQGKEATA